VVSAGRALLCWQAEFEERVRGTQEGEVLCFRGRRGRDRKVVQLPFLPNKMKSVIHCYRKKTAKMKDCSLCMLKGQKPCRDALQS